MNWKPGRPTLSKARWSVPPVFAGDDGVGAEVVEGLQPTLEDRHDGGVALSVDAADLAAAVVEVEVGREMLVAGLRLDRPGPLAQELRKLELFRVLALGA